MTDGIFRWSKKRKNPKEKFSNINARSFVDSRLKTRASMKSVKIVMELMNY